MASAPIIRDYSEKEKDATSDAPDSSKKEQDNGVKVTMLDAGLSATLSSDIAPSR